jgi:hypothetical protein
LCTLAVYPYSKEVTELQFVAAGDLQDKLERLPVLEEAVLPLSPTGGTHERRTLSYKAIEQAIELAQTTLEQDWARTAKPVSRVFLTYSD